MVETTQGNGAEPRRPKKVQRKGPAKTSKAAALAQLVERPELVGNVSAAARQWGVSRSTARTWIADAAMAVPPEPPLIAIAEPPPEVGTSGAIAEPSPVTSSPVAGAMVNPSYDEPFQAEPPRRDERPRQEAPMAATMVDGASPGDGASSAMAALAYTLFPAMAEPIAPPSPAMAATVTEPALVEQSAGVPAPLEPPQWRTVARPVWHPTVPVLCQWVFGGMSVALSFVLYAISTFLNMTFWASLNPDMTAKMILATAGFTVEFSNYVIPTVLAFAPSSKLGLRRVVRAVWCLTMVITAIAGAGVVKSSLGASHESRNQIINDRLRLEGIINSPMTPVSDDAVIDARKRVEAAKGVRKAECAPVRTKDIDRCNQSTEAVRQAEAALASENTKHANAVTAAEQQHRTDVADAKDKFGRLSVISADLDMVAAGVEAIVPGVPEAWVTRGVVVLWVLLFSIGPCAFLRLGLVTIEEGYR
jgi:hypothetical protein